jgi:hypothetical protein
MILSLGEVMSLATHFAGRSDFATSEASRLANLALTEVTSRIPHAPKEAMALSNFTGTGNEFSVALPADFGGVTGLIWYSSSTDPDSGENILDEKVELQIRDSAFLDSRSSTSGVPEYYTLYGGVLELDPAPSSRGSMILRYEANQPALVLSADTPALDERWHMGWVYKTTELVHRARSNSAAAAEAAGMYVNYMVSTPNDRTMEQFARSGMGLQLKKNR